MSTQNGLTVHLRYAPLASRGPFKGRSFEVVEDLPTLLNTCVKPAMRQPVRFVRLIPEGRDLGFSHEAGALSFTVDQFSGHAMVEVQIG
jgi:hypothetical protein